MASKNGYGCGMGVDLHCYDDDISIDCHGPSSDGVHPVWIRSCGQAICLFMRLDQVEQLSAVLASYVQDQQRQKIEPDGWSEAAQRVMA